MTVEPLTSERLRLEPLTVDHAPAMVAVLADPSIYEFTGGSPPTLSSSPSATPASPPAARPTAPSSG